MANEKKSTLTTTLFIGAGLITAAAIYVGVSSASPVETQPPVTVVEPQQPKERPKVDVVFVLDTTSSMSGMIEGAKRKI